VHVLVVAMFLWRVGGVPSAMECLVEDRGLTFYHSSIIGDLDLLDGG
jgi:hypothetical protein